MNELQTVKLLEQIKKLEARVEELERYQEYRGQFWSLNEGAARFYVGQASLTMKKDGTLILKGKDLELDASGKIQIKALGAVSIKGAKVMEN